MKPPLIWADITMTGAELRRIVHALRYVREHYDIHNVDDDPDPFLDKLEELLQELDDVA